ncbi:MAG: methyl-accepting chemotaxis protein, partial [Treponema sp.]|nr:methyl-accepting chemotaxis protein [Treponema sp.]
EKINDVVQGSMSIMEGMINEINGVSDNVNSQKESIKKASNSVDEIFSSVDSFRKTVMDQSSLVSESSHAVEKMISSISTVRTTAEDTRQTMDILGKSSDSGRKMLLQLLEELGNVQNQSSSLQVANRTISDIAAQTNILAMNAAIEAAHAGEAGRGFAVVAGEVRKLAELSSKESESVSREIQKMGKIIAHIGTVSQETSRAMDTIFRGVSDVNMSFKTIDSSIREQAEEGVQVLGALKTVQDITVRVKSDTETIYTQSSAIHTEVEKLQEVSQMVNNGVGSVRSASGEISSFLQNVKSLSSS